MADPPFGTDEWIAQADAEAKTKGCPRCAMIGGLSIGRELIARPLGTWSLAGSMVKVSAVNAIVLRCGHCTFAASLSEARGEGTEHGRAES